MKRIVCLLMAGLTMAGMTACGTPAAKETKGAESPSEFSQSIAETKTPEPVPEPAVVFTDAALEAKVREAMGKPEGEITVAEAEAVVKLDLSNESFDDMNSQNGGIRDISG